MRVRVRVRGAGTNKQGSNIPLEALVWARARGDARAGDGESGPIMDGDLPIRSRRWRDVSDSWRARGHAFAERPYF